MQQQHEVAARVRRVIDAAGVSAREFARRIVIDRRSSPGPSTAPGASPPPNWPGSRTPAAWTWDGCSGLRPVRRRRSTVRSPSAPRLPPASTEGGRPLQIVRETVRLIAERGFHAVRVADIAAACHTSTAAIHYHFPGRDELLEAAVRWCMDEDTRRRADATAGARHAGDELRLLIELQTPRTEQQRRQWCVWLDLWAEAARSTTVGQLHVEYYRQWRGTVADVIRRGVGQGVFRPVDADGAALTLTALIDGLASQVLATAPGHPGTGAQTMHDALIAHVSACLAAPAAD
uniref:DNA-binding protein n=1 Tax=Streptomyces griseus TaxID=1911 RepID=Q9XDV7_STRGR|nr:DNA-binding protein [Streptomyces griseus] [Streptomyces griseus subsp. griseus NBRC 13350]